MTKHLLSVILITCIVKLADAQHPFSRIYEKKGILYFSAGSHRAYYTPSDIRLVGQSHTTFDFTLKNVKGRDDGGVRFHTSPQYSYNLGYYSLKKNFGIEYQFDHVKYTVKQDQSVHMEGFISEQWYDQDTVLHSQFVQLEHTDGANYAMLNFVKWRNLATSRDLKRSLDLFIKAGGGIVIPKTNSTIMNRHYDDKYAVSGFAVGVEPGIRYNFLKNFFASASIKGSYANYTKFRIAEGYGQQKWVSVQFNLMLGTQLPF